MWKSCSRATKPPLQIKLYSRKEEGGGKEERDRRESERESKRENEGEKESERKQEKELQRENKAFVVWHQFAVCYVKPSCLPW